MQHCQLLQIMTEGVRTEPSRSLASVDLFQEITKSEINQETLNLDSSKACQESDLPTKIIKANSDIFRLRSMQFSLYHETGQC